MLSIRTCITCVLVMSVTSPSIAIVIDDFTVGPISLVRDSGVPVVFAQSGLDTSHVVGGRRDFLLGASNRDGQTATIDTATGQFTLGVNEPATLAYLTLSYGSEDQPLNLDLTADGSDRFVFDFPSDTGFSFLQLTSPGANQGSSRISETVLFSAFPSVDLTNVSSITLTAGRSQGFVLNSIRTVPEPFTSTLLAVGILGLVAARRR